MLRVLDIFSGIGGFSLGLERTGGFRTVAFCEVDPFCRKVLAKHWPDVPCYEDVRELTAARLASDGIAVDVICGGFPCQDISFAGKRAGLEGARSGLWGEYRRLIGELRPGFVIVENVPGLLSLGMGTVLGDLSALGFDAVWDCVPASAVGAPHRRDRVWLVAYSSGGGAGAAQQPRQLRCSLVGSEDAPDANGNQLRQQPGRRGRSRRASETQPGEHGTARAVADADKFVGDQGRQSDTSEIEGGRNAHRGGVLAHVRKTNVSGLAFREGQSPDVGEELAPAVGADWWCVEPDVGRVAHGVPARVDRLRALGNAVVPQIVEVIGRSILQAEQAA
jgi:DNA (cytosine-5)-methyltransferase 1